MSRKNWEALLVIGVFLAIVFVGGNLLNPVLTHKDEKPLKEDRPSCYDILRNIQFYKDEGLTEWINDCRQ